ncbi:MAG: ATP-binding protein [Desulfobacterales bacterium]
MNDQASSSPIRILLVEDNEHDQIAFLRALAKSDTPFEVTVCERAEVIPTVLQAGSESLDIVVIDQDLPGISGLAAYKKLQQKGGIPPFVMLTGTGSENLAVDALKAGIYDYIIKDPNQGYLLLLPLKLKDVKQRYDDLMTRLKAEADLKQAHSELDKMVKLRTAELSRTVEALVEEIAERTQTEKALRDSKQALRRLSLKIIETQENERRQIAKELHDSIGSSLAAIKFAVEGKLLTMKKSPPNDTIPLEKIAVHIHDTINEVRRISTSLRPSMLDDLGLLATIKWYCRSSGEMHAYTRIETKLALNDDEAPEYSKIVIYRVLQEALNNALRHSGADTIRVSLEAVHDCIRLCVKDNGCGFDPDEAMQGSDPLSGYGLKGMRDRADVIGGSLSLDSSPGRGTSVCLELPAEQDWAHSRHND